MPMSIAKQLSFEHKPSRKTIQLVDRFNVKKRHIKKRDRKRRAKKIEMASPRLGGALDFGPPQCYPDTQLFTSANAT